MKKINLLLFIIAISFHDSISQHTITPVLQKAINFTNEDAFDSSAYYFEQARSDLFLSNDSIRAIAYSSLHDLLWYKNKFDSALKVISYAIEKHHAYKNYSLEGYSYRARSLDYLIQGQYNKAIQDGQSGINIFQTIGDTIGWAGALSNLSNINHDIFEFDMGIAYGEEAVALLKEHSVGDPDRLAYALNCIAINYDDKGEHQQAINYHLMVIELMPTMKKERNKARTYNNIGNSLMKLGRYGEAIGWLQEHEKLCVKLGSKYGLATSRTNLGTLSYLNKEFENAKMYLENAEAISYEIHDMEKIHDVLFQQYKMYLSWGKHKPALEYMERFHYLKDSLLNEKKTQQLYELQTQFETEKKEQQIALQNAEIAQQKAQNQRNFVIILSLAVVILFLVIIYLLQRSRQAKKQAFIVQQAETLLRQSQIEAALNSQELERKRFARDLHDGFGQMISVLNLNLKSLEQGTSSKEEIFEKSSQILGEMYKELKGICFNLMPETLIKQGVVTALREFAQRISNSGHLHIQIDSFGIEERLSDLQEISIYRITQEWVNNILKYANATRVTVSLTKDEQEITLLIEDNGTGFDKKLLSSGNGNGWKNLNSRANLLKGELELDTSLGVQGSTLIINIPVFVSKLESTKKLA